MDRREFLAGAALAATATAASSKLALEGGTPVRATPLHAGYYGTQFYDDKERRELLETLETQRPFRWYGPGNEPPRKVITFEREFAARMGTKFALAVTSGTAALQTAVAALELGPGDEVILPAWTWHSCFNAIVLAGALPVFAEIDESFNLNPDDVERHITPQTKALMIVHLQGNPADMDRLLPIARRHKLQVIEDCAQSVGASYKGRPLGSMGDVAIYSLQLNKTITAGEGGAVATSNPEIFERATRYHDLGLLRPVHQEWVGAAQVEPFLGAGFRLNEFSGGVLLAQVRKLDTILDAVRVRSRRVYAGIRDLPGIRLRRLPDPAGEIGSAVFVGFDSKGKRDRFLAAMKAENVPAAPPSGSVILPVVPQIEQKRTVHPKWPSFTSDRGKTIQYGAACCPQTIDVLNRFAGVPIDPKFAVADVDDIVAAIRKVYPQVA
jgi:8-amino-3,8-dideoxy-alpha-D-manno-octulosonate transaminase